MLITRRALFDTLSKPELLEIARRCELDVHGKMTKEDLLDRLVPSERAELAKILPTLAHGAIFVGQSLIAAGAGAYEVCCRWR